MLDLVEGAKIINALAPTTQGAATVKADYVKMENANTVWAIVNVKTHTSGPTVTPYVASDVGGTGVAAVSGGAKFWVNNNTTQLDRMVASTAVTAQAFTDAATDGLMVVRYDPAEAASSNDCFAIGLTTAGGTADGTVSVTYILDSRYKGYQQVIATTSST